MSLLNRILKSRKQKATPKDPLTNLQEADKAKLQSIALSANDSKVREEAIARMGYGKELLNLATGGHSVKVKTLARRQVGACLEKDLSLLDNLLNSQSGSQAELINLVSCSGRAIEKVFSSVTDEKVLIDIALNGATSAIRQSAAEKIVTREQLEFLLAELGSKDKSVAKITKAKLDAFKKADELTEERKSKIQQLCVDQENLRKRKVDDYFFHRLEELSLEWANIGAEEKSEFIERFEQSAKTCREMAEEEQQRKQKVQDLGEKRNAVLQVVNNAKDQLRRLLINLYETEQVESEALQQILSQYDSQINKIAVEFPELQSKIKLYFNLLKGAQTLSSDINRFGSPLKLLGELEQADGETGAPIIRNLKKLLSHAQLLGDTSIETIDKSRIAIDQWSQSEKEKQGKEKAFLKKINDLARKTNWAIDNGRIRQARGIYKELQEKKGSHDLPASILRRLEDLDSAMEKLGDWHEFAVQPKKQAVVEKMEALIDAKLHPNDLSDRIKALQDEWKTLCKGGKNQDKELWDRLQSAADKAFEPCREYFDEQMKEREQNAVEREKLIEQLNQYLNSYKWEDLVWKDVDKTLNLAKETWKNLWPVPRKDTKTLQKSFDNTLEKINAKLKDARQANHNAKNKLVEQAESLASTEDVAQAVEEAKKLQSQWKSLGGTGGRGRSEDQKLWQKFRTACDVIFEKREQEDQVARQKHVEERDMAQCLLQKFDDILAKSEQDFFNARKNVKQIEEEIKSISDLPAKDLRKIVSECNNKLQQIEEKAKLERLALAQDAWHRVFDVANLIRAHEESIKNDTVAEQSLEEIADEIAEVNDWPSKTQAVIEERLSKVKERQIDSLDSEKDLRLLCIRKEISLGVESPEEDKALRMEYQVAQLKLGFGNNSYSSEQGEALALEWLSIPGAEEPSYSQLLQRFYPDLFKI